MPRYLFDRKGLERLRKRVGDPLLTALTIMLAILLFVVAPLQAAGIVAAHYFGLAFALLLLGAVFLVSGSVAAMGAILLSLGLVLAATVLRLRQPAILDIYLDAAAWLLAGVTLAVVAARAVFAPGRVTFHRIIGAVLLYLDIGLVFVALYGFMALVVPEAFKGLAPLQDKLGVAANLIYFSFVTLTSVGYGDIAPLHPLARGVANVESIIGQLYPATLLARLVTLQLAGQNRG
jgi:hypothetical protein